MPCTCLAFRAEQQALWHAGNSLSNLLAGWPLLAACQSWHCSVVNPQQPSKMGTVTGVCALSEHVLDDAATWSVLHGAPMNMPDMHVEFVRRGAYTSRCNQSSRFNGNGNSADEPVLP